jgi:pyruvate formate-lyase/glycerol dehydratase family glycyl radical enzyme
MPSEPTLDELWRNPSAAYPPSQWGHTAPTPGSERIRDRLLNRRREVDLERARYATESYWQTEGEPMILRRAKMLRHLAQEMSLTIDPDELIVGNRSRLPRMGVIAPEGAVDWIDRELETLPTRPQDPFDITPDQIQELREEIFPYWPGKTLEDQVARQVPEDVRQAVAGKVFSLNQTDHAQGHIVPDVKGWLNLGVAGLRTRVEEARHQPSVHERRHQTFYDAVLTALEAAETLMRRYGALAAEHAAQSEDPVRTHELERIASICTWIATRPPRTFWEALQSLWFLFVLLQMESNASSFSPGRLDQILWPYLAGDLEDGTLTLPEAQRLLERLWLKFNEVVLLRSSSSARYFAGFPIGFNIVLGGQRPAGGDATNALSYMGLRAQADLGLTQPNLSIRIHEHSPQRFLETAAYVISLGSGMPQVFNDEVIIPGQIDRGIPPETAHNYAVVGCVELSTPGKALGWSDASLFNMTRVLELTLFGGKDPQTGEQIGLPTPSLTEIGSFEELEAAYDQQLTHFVTLMVKGCNTVDRVHGEVIPSPFLSSVIGDCINTGTDVTAGGAQYNFSGVQGVQIANVADSLAAVKRGVFERGWMPAADLMDALRDDYADHEPIRQRLLNCAPKYGNDVDQVDALAAQWADRYSEIVAQHRNIRGGTYQPGFYTVSAHVPMGADVGATPDGRHAGAPLADGGLSPSAGRDRKGPTAVLRSVGKLNLKLASNGTLLNMKFLPDALEGRENLTTFAALLRAFSALKIPHVQFNVVSAETLRRAQATPDAYRNLVVRVAGYSAYFTELDRALQDEIVERTAFQAVA